MLNEIRGLLTFLFSALAVWGRQRAWGAWYWLENVAFVGRYKVRRFFRNIRRAPRRLRIWILLQHEHWWVHREWMERPGRPYWRGLRADLRWFFWQRHAETRRQRRLAAAQDLYDARWMHQSRD